MEEPPELLILRNGTVAYCTNLAGSDFTNTPIDIVKVKKGMSPKLLHLNFFDLGGDKKMIIKSMKYSIISHIKL